MNKVISRIIRAIYRVLYTNSSIMADAFVWLNPKYSQATILNKFEYSVFSQHGEDGIINEIFKRISTTNQFFVEFGVGNGLENNTASLLFQGWKGIWIEGSQQYFKDITANTKKIAETGRLRVINSFITAENIEKLLENDVPTDLDLLSIDIDGNDFWVWKAIETLKPRVVVIEYNAFWGPSVSWVMPYNSTHTWDEKSVYHGASLKALQELGTLKGYTLVACDMSGTNAFFVRSDLYTSAFHPIHTSEAHFEPARHFLHKNFGHQKTYKVFDTI